MSHRPRAVRPVPGQDTAGFVLAVVLAVGGLALLGSMGKGREVQPAPVRPIEPLPAKRSIG